MSPIKFILNDREVATVLPAGTVTLDFIRREQGLTGVKESCREGECGSCTILLGELEDNRVIYKAVVSCLLPIGELHGKHVVTIEGLNRDRLTPVQQALVDQGAVQCGFCTPGIVLSLTGFLLGEETPDSPAAIDALDGNICRCTGYVSIKRAAEFLCSEIREKSSLSKKALKKEKNVPDSSLAGVAAPQVEKAGKGKKSSNGGVPIEKLVEWGVVPRYFLDIPGRLEILGAPSPSPAGVGKVLAAGETDLFVQKGEEATSLELDFLSRYPGLSGIKEENKSIFIGAGTSTEEIKNSALLARFFPGMKGYLSQVASKLIRGRATLGGNIANASPIADLVIFFLALRSVVLLGKNGRQREVALEKFFKGYKQLDLRKGEKITGIRFPKPESGAFFNFEKVSRRKYLDIASCNSAIYLTMQNGEAFGGEKGTVESSEAKQKFLAPLRGEAIRSAGDVVKAKMQDLPYPTGAKRVGAPHPRRQKIKEIHISAGGVAPIPLYLGKTCRFLTGKEINAKNIRAAARVLQQEIAPISDVRGLADYKRLLLRQLFFAHFLKFFPDLLELEALL